MFTPDAIQAQIEFCRKNGTEITEGQALAILEAQAHEDFYIFAAWEAAERCVCPLTDIPSTWTNRFH